MDVDKDHRSFVYALAAATISITTVGSRQEPDIFRQVALLTSHSLEIRGPVISHKNISIRMIMTSVFVQISLAGIQDPITSWFHLREAMTMAQILRIDHPQSLAEFDMTERAQRQRLYWMLFIHERFLAIWDNRTIMFSPSLPLPAPDPTLSQNIQEGFNLIIKLFRLVDKEFLDNWQCRDTSTSLRSPAWITSKQAELDDEVYDLGSSLQMVTEVQRIDITITRQWLRIILWRIALTGHLLTPNAQNECMSLHFPITLAGPLQVLLAGLSQSSIEGYGCRILQKLFQITTTIADVVLNVSADTLEEDVGRIDALLFLIRFLLQACGTSAVHRHVLAEKLETLYRKFPVLERLIMETPSVSRNKGNTLSTSNFTTGSWEN
jgi:hypothetical protein